MMIYTLAIDWLTIYCIYMGSDDFTPVDNGSFTWKKEPFGTRQFSRFFRIRRPNEDGKIEEFAEIQATPYSSILPPYAVMVRFVNRTLYLPNFWELAEELLVANNLAANSISRIDVCADFNQFACIDPKTLIEGFAAKKFRHIGRGVGALYFNHGIGAERDDHDKPVKDYGVCYTGLSFGTHGSDAHVYLYNKSEELKTQGEKPWIRDTWNSAGLDGRHVWRLEVSIKSGGLSFKDKGTGKDITVNIPMVYDTMELDKIYHTFVRRLFSFIPNRKGITNITHEFKKNGLMLFEGKPAYDRGVIRNISSGNRMERILIKQLHQFADKYRGVYDAEGVSQQLAWRLARATGLDDWYDNAQNLWEKPILK